MDIADQYLGAGKNRNFAEIGMVWHSRMVIDGILCLHGMVSRAEYSEHGRECESGGYFLGYCRWGFLFCRGCYLYVKKTGFVARSLWFS